MADRAGERERVAVEAGDRTADQRVGGAGPVDVGGDHGVDPVPGTHQPLEPRVVERLAEVHEPAAAPAADRGPSQLHPPER